ncbi:MAG: M48 family metallopeptidase [Phycisphaerales bacterium]|nr:MAG: M48 family metallopeptidase [Phycisphaerales bacterium]
MAIDFFESQDVARKKTGRLVFLFVLAVLVIIAALHLMAVWVLSWSASRGDPSARGFQWSDLLNLQVLGVVALGTIVVVGTGCMYKLLQLRAGGAVIAEGLGGQLVYPDSTDPAQRRLLNVVEEMAIASGTPVPPVYLLKDEGGINAFAAGYSPGDAVIGVTRGCVNRLSRDELQGVIAHEYSHILNGDMRTNIRLIGVLHGILIIGVIGYYVLRTAMYSGGARRRSSKGGGNPLPIIAIGGGLMIVGFAGTFFGNLIKAAVSRQREFLADASAVQFTRNPQGISGALKRIGGFSQGARIDNPNAPEASHMFFGRGVTSGLSAMFSTHPPLAKRIKRIEPSWDGAFMEEDAVPKQTSAARPAVGAVGVVGLAAAQAYPTKSGGRGGGVVDQVGRPTEAHVQRAAELIEKIPEEVKAAAHEPYGARAVIYAILTDKDPEPRRLQLEQLARHGDPGVNQATKKLLPIVERLDAEVRLPLLDMTMPALRALTLEQYKVFKTNVVELVKADNRIDLFEWVLQRILLRHLEPQFAAAKPPRVIHYALNRLRHECEMLLSVLAYGGHRTVDQARLAFDLATKPLGLLQMTLLKKERCGLGALGNALDQLAQSAPRLKRQLLTACAECVSADREVTVHEAELLRAIADSLDCPMPPLLPGQSLT